MAMIVTLSVRRTVMILFPLFLYIVALLTLLSGGGRGIVHGFTTAVSTRDCFQITVSSSSSLSRRPVSISCRRRGKQSGGGSSYPSLSSNNAAVLRQSSFPCRSRLYSPFCLSVVASSSGVSQEEQEQVDDDASSNSTNKNAATARFPFWWPGKRRRKLDDLDKRLIAQTIPVIFAFAASPVIGFVDLFWINQMGSPLAVAGQAAANAMFSTLFWATSFLPSVAATLIAKENAEMQQSSQSSSSSAATQEDDDDKRRERVQDSICQSLFVSILLAIIAKICLLRYSTPLLSMILPPGAPALQYARPYLYIRAFGFLPSIISLVSYAAFRGVQDNVTPVKISIFANFVNAILDPIFIFTCRMGVSGAAVATLIAETASAVAYLFILRRRRLIRFAKIFRLPAWSALSPLIRRSAALQLRNLAMNFTFLMVARVAQGLDATGVAAAAHALAIQAFQVGGIVLLALSTVSQTVIPTDLVERFETIDTAITTTTTGEGDANKLNQESQQVRRKVGGLAYAQNSANRLMSWSFVLSIVLGFCQLASLPLIRSSTPSKAVRDAAYIPTILASILTLWNGPVFVGEGIMIGTSSFLRLSLGTVVATIGCVSALYV
jgi:putative MATE family efflux protein